MLSSFAMRHLKFSFFLFIFVIFPLSVNSEESKFNFWGNKEVFALSPVTDGILLGTGVLLSGGDLILDNVLELNRQEYDDRFFDKNDVNSLDRKFMHSYSKNRDKAADFLLVATMATPAVLVSCEREEWLTCGVMYAETLLISNGIKELIKLGVNRTRPYMYYDSETYPEDDVKDGDWANSFPSGHSTMAFASATFASYTFCKYFPESSWRYPVVAGSYAMAAGVAALRLSSGNHFFTDVAAGALIGSSVGFLTPWLHTFNAKNDLNVVLLPNGVSFKLKV